MPVTSYSAPNYQGSTPYPIETSLAANASHDGGAWSRLHQYQGERVNQQDDYHKYMMALNAMQGNNQALQAQDANQTNALKLVDALKIPGIGDAIRGNPILQQLSGTGYNTADAFSQALAEADIFAKRGAGVSSYAEGGQVAPFGQHIRGPDGNLISSSGIGARVAAAGVVPSVTTSTINPFMDGAEVSKQNRGPTPTGQGGLGNAIPGVNTPMQMPGHVPDTGMSRNQGSGQTGQAGGQAQTTQAKPAKQSPPPTQAAVLSTVQSYSSGRPEAGKDIAAAGKLRPRVVPDPERQGGYIIEVTGASGAVYRMRQT